MPMQKSARMAGWGCFQGDSFWVRFPRAKALGCSVFALRAIADKLKEWDGRLARLMFNPLTGETPIPLFFLKKSSSTLFVRPQASLSPAGLADSVYRIT